MAFDGGNYLLAFGSIPRLKNGDPTHEHQRPPGKEADVIGLVGDTGLEPVTSCMSSKCSNQLS